MAHRAKHRNAALRRRIETGHATNYDLNHPDGQARWQAMVKTFTPQQKRRSTIARKKVVAEQEEARLAAEQAEA
jgi:hypothetical protein